MRHTFPTSEPVHLDVTLRAGHLTVTASAALTEAVVDIEPTSAGDDAALAVTFDGHALAIRDTRQHRGLRRCRADRAVTVTVPDGSRARLRTGSADIDIRGTFGALAMATGSGDIQVQRVDGPSEGRSGSGDIRVGRAVAPLALGAGSGDLVVDAAAAPLHLKVGSGDATVHTASGDLHVTTGSGDVRLASVSGGTVRVRAGSGDVSIGVPLGIPVYAEVDAGGGVTNRLTPRGRPEPGQDHVRLRVHTGAGSLRLSDA